MSPTTDIAIQVAIAHDEAQGCSDATGHRVQEALVNQHRLGSTDRCERCGKVAKGTPTDLARRLDGHLPWEAWKDTCFEAGAAFVVTVEHACSLSPTHWNTYGVPVEGPPSLWAN